MKDYFPNVEKIGFEGPDSDNPLAFRYYNPEELIGGKKAGERLRFAVAYWHTFCGEGRDMFGEPFFERSWNRYADPYDRSIAKADAAFEFMSKLGVSYFCAHDRDLAPELDTLRQTNALMDRVIPHIQALMKETGIKLLWGTANLFSSPKYLHGAATSPDAKVFAYAAGQVKKALEVTLALGGEGYVFWGGREGYETLLNTDMKRELDHLAAFYRIILDYAREIRFEGQFLIEPKPKEPTKHQYDFDAAHSLAFLQRYGLEPYFKFNIEANHATLAGHTFQHELRYSRMVGKLGSVDANMGDLLLGWDTDHFPTNMYDTMLAMYEILLNGGLAPGGLNFDAHVRRGSYEKKDLFLSHIAAMDAFAIGLKAAKMMIEHPFLERGIQERYVSFDSGLGAEIEKGPVDIHSLESAIIDTPIPLPASGRQEWLENYLNRLLLSVVR
ncbi:MAG TPA: xylose isomerase [Thermotogota bacterium]|nr:xylose isomerase [Thermotogota bacterium]HOS24188.1 xylose isomerase [Thermotogota bacterium]HOT87744.1 xylose isomerase [Thermotogota bacterium]HPD35313.1 xylose isomerase [Thermotogota bacterium]HPL38363.1 xylose isomerase [Thermotogota bacterium]